MFCQTLLYVWHFHFCEDWSDLAKKLKTSEFLVEFKSKIQLTLEAFYI